MGMLEHVDPRVVTDAGSKRKRESTLTLLWLIICQFVALSYQEVSKSTLGLVSHSDLQSVRFVRLAGASPGWKLDALTEMPT